MSDLEDASEYEEAPPSSSTNKRPRRSNAGNNSNTAAAAAPAAPAAPAPAKGRGGARGAAAKKNSGSNANGPSQSPADGHHNDTDEGNDPASARKLQNRTAQREFRQRKLQYVKDLEARVEFLSSPRDDQLEILKALLHGFIEENKQLRHLVQAISGFVGTGMGGKSWELGFKKDEDYEDFVKRSDKDTLHRLYEEWQVKMQVEKDAQSKDPDSAYTGEGSGSGRSAPAKRGSGGAKNGLAASASRASSPAAAPATRANSGSNSNSKRKAGGDGNARSDGRQQDDVSPPPPYPPTGAGAGGTMSNAQRLASLTNLQRADNASPDGEERRQSPVTSMSASSRSTVQNTGFPPPGPPQQPQQQYPHQQQQPLVPQSSYESTGFGYASAGPSMGPSAGRGRLPVGSTFNPSSAFGLGTNLSASAPASEYSGQHNQNQNSFGRQQPYGSNSWSMSSAPMNDLTGSGSAQASSGFFFDTAEPLSMPTSSFTNDFLSEYASTGLTPIFDAAPFSGTGAGYNWFAPEGGAMTGNLGLAGATGPAIDHDTPSSSTSSNYVAQPQQPFQSVGSSLSGPPLTNLQQQIAHENRYHQRLEDKVVANAHRFKLPKGITPEDVITSSPLLALIHTVSYHMRNKATNPEYVLPDVLKPTALQISTPHDFRIDGFLFAGMRDSMILNTEYDLDDVFADLVDNATVHPGEVILDPGNCEISEGFLRKYKNLISDDALAVSNKWRKSRGEPEVVL